MTFEEMLERDGVLVYTNKGVSMLPLLRQDRDLMEIRTLTREPAKYDAVLFRRRGIKGRGEYVVHRIMKVMDGNRYFIIGDNCVGGEVVDRDQILGVLTAVRRDGRTVRCDGTGCLLYVHLWWGIYPLRVLYKKSRNLAGRVVRRFLR